MIFYRINFKEGKTRLKKSKVGYLRKLRMPLDFYLIVDEKTGVLEDIEIESHTLDNTSVTEIVEMVEQLSILVKSGYIDFYIYGIIGVCGLRVKRNKIEFLQEVFKPVKNMKRKEWEQRLYNMSY